MVPKKWIDFAKKVYQKIYWKELFAAFFIVLAIYFFRQERRELGHVLPALKRAHASWVYVGLLVTGMYILLQALMYVCSFIAVHSRLSLGRSIELFLKRNLLSVFIPAGGVSALAYQPVSFRRAGINKIAVHQASALYGAVGILSVVIVGVPVLAYASFHGHAFGQAYVGLVIVVAVLAGAYFLWRSMRPAGKVRVWLGRKYPAVEQQWDQLFQADYVQRGLWLTVLGSVGIELAGIAHVLIAMYAIGVVPSFEAACVTYIVTTIFLIVSPFLRGLGAIELSMVYVLQQFGYTTEQALAMTLLYRIFEFWLPLAAGVLSFLLKGRHLFLRLFPAVLTFALGLVNIVSVLTPPLTDRIHHLREFLPLESIQASNLLVIIVGIFLLIAAAFLLRGYRSAWLIALVFSVLSLVGNLMKAFDYEEALLSLVVCVSLLSTSRYYRLKNDPTWNGPTWMMGVAVVGLVLLFGATGFYFLDIRHFHIDFTWRQSLWYSLKNFLLIHDDTIRPATRFGREFIGFLHLLGIVAWLFLLYSLVRPYFRGRELHVTDQMRARALLEMYGSSPVDYFKTYADKVIFFSEHYEGFVSYRIANGFAIVLEEPVCAETYKVAVLKEFEFRCRQMGLRSVFYRVDEESIPYFDVLRKKKMLIGQEAIVDVPDFSLDGGDKKSLRNGLNSLKKKGFVTRTHRAPLLPEFVRQLQVVSDEWLETFERKEVVFSQGLFDAVEISHQDVISLEDEMGVVKAFLNIIPDFAPGECTYDLIRKTADAPGACMDALIIEMIAYARHGGLGYLNMGLVPMTGILQPDNTAEQLMKFASERMRRFRNYQGLREFKEKYASRWINKYLVYEHDADLLQLPVALNKVMQP